MEERVGFEPTVLFSTSVFKTDALNRSATFPFCNLNLVVVKTNNHLILFLGSYLAIASTAEYLGVSVPVIVSAPVKVSIL